MSAAGTNQHGDRDRDGDKQNNQSNDDKHVDASDPGARSPVHAVLERLSTMLTYNVNNSVGEVTVVGILSPDASVPRAVGPIGRCCCRTSVFVIMLHCNQVRACRSDFPQEANPIR
jgi:hypothetical protein